jgi:ribonuclease-3
MILEDILGYSFKRKILLTQALTPPVLQQRKQGKAFERLEFLGDRVLGLVIAEALYVYYSHDEEGKLAKRLSYLTSREFCHIIAERIDLAQFIPIKIDELKGTSVLANCVESIIAALYIDGGLEASQNFIHKYWSDAIHNVEELPKDSKTLVQEWAQKKGMEIPEYKEIGRSGPDHAPNYVLEISLQNGWTATGEGKNKKYAERDAAQKLWHIIASQKS